jgi:hypothetical protein
MLLPRGGRMSAGEGKSQLKHVPWHPVLSQERLGGMSRCYHLSSISGSQQGPSRCSFLTAGSLSDSLARCEGVDVRFA